MSKQEALSSFITGIFNTLSRKVRPWNGRYFYSVGSDGLGDFWGHKSYDQYLKDFNEIPELNAIINYRAKAESRVKLEVVNKKTGEPVKNNDPLVRILRRPNWFQNQTEWWRQASLFRSIFGNEYHYALTPSGMGTNYKALFTLPPQMMYIYCPVKYFYLEPTMPDSIQYYFKLPGEQEKKPISTKDIIHINDNAVNYSFDKDQNDTQMRRNYLYGTSRQMSLSPNLENIRVSYEGRNTLRKLPVGVLTNKAKDGSGTQPMLPDEKNELDKGMNKYGIELGKRQLILTGLTIGFEQTLVDISKLELYKEIEEDVQEICNAYGVPFELVGKTDITFENKKYAEKQMYQDSIIPTTAERVEALNQQFGTEDKPWEIIGTFDHLPIFQDNVKERAQSLNLLVSALSKALADGAITGDIYMSELAKFGIK